MKRFFPLITCIFFCSGILFSQTLLPGLQIDEVDGQTIYTCEADFFDSGGHYVDC
jgi:hypothetical protein